MLLMQIKCHRNQTYLMMANVNLAKRRESDLRVTTTQRQSNIYLSVSNAFTPKTDDEKASNKILSDYPFTIGANPDGVIETILLF